MKIALIENLGVDFFHARLRYALHLQNLGFEVYAIVPDDGFLEKIKSHGINDTARAPRKSGPPQQCIGRTPAPFVAEAPSPQGRPLKAPARPGGEGPAVQPPERCRIHCKRTPATRCISSVDSCHPLSTGF